MDLTPAQFTGLRMHLAQERKYEQDQRAWMILNIANNSGPKKRALKRRDILKTDTVALVGKKGEKMPESTIPIEIKNQYRETANYLVDRFNLTERFGIEKKARLVPDLVRRG